MSAASATASPREISSADGRLAFPSLDELRLVSVNSDGTGSWPVAIGQFRDPAYSPDGASIALQSSGALWTFTAAGKPERQLSAPGEIADNPAWSPDGTTVAFNVQLVDISAIKEVNADGTGVTQLTNNAATDDFPAWSPDGKQLAFTSERSGMEQAEASHQPVVAYVFFRHECCQGPW